MASWENLVTPASSGGLSLSRNDKQPEKKKNTQERFEDSFENNASIWKDFREYEVYSAGRMYGACPGPDQATLRDIVTKFTSMVSQLIQDSHWRADKPVDKDALKLFELATKVATNMETEETKIPPIKMIAFLNGFCDGYIATCDPDSVRNLSYGVS